MSAEPNTLLTLKNLSVGYGSQPIVSALNITFVRGKFYALLGANGSGKTTLLKTIAGIVKPLSGEILPALSARPHALGYVPQRETLDAAFLLSGFEVALMGVCGRIGPGRRISKEERGYVEECLRQAECADFAKQRFSELSGGQRQRILIARALATRPDFLLLDEPTAGIDTAATQSIMELLVKIRDERGITILMVNHDLPMMRRFVEEVIWLRHGSCIQGTAAELLSRERVEELLEISWS